MLWFKRIVGAFWSQLLCSIHFLSHLWNRVWTFLRTALCLGRCGKGKVSGLHAPLSPRSVALLRIQIVRCVHKATFCVCVVGNLVPSRSSILGLSHFVLTHSREQPECGGVGAWKRLHVTSVMGNEGNSCFWLIAAGCCANCTEALLRVSAWTWRRAASLHFYSPLPPLMLICTDNEQKTWFLFFIPFFKLSSLLLL